eukprot:908439-Karenia_brevis.AAC.1
MARGECDEESMKLFTSASISAAMAPSGGSGICDCDCGIGMALIPCGAAVDNLDGIEWLDIFGDGGG